MKKTRKPIRRIRVQNFKENKLTITKARKITNFINSITHPSLKRKILKIRRNISKRKIRNFIRNIITMEMELKVPKIKIKGLWIEEIIKIQRKRSFQRKEKVIEMDVGIVVEHIMQISIH